MINNKIKRIFKDIVFRSCAMTKARFYSEIIFDCINVMELSSFRTTYMYTC